MIRLLRRHRKVPFTSVFQTEVRRHGRVVHSSCRRNLRTSSANPRSGIDWQSKVMGGDVANRVDSGTSTTAPTATTFTLDGESAPGATDFWYGHIVVRGTTFGVITTNTNVSNPVLTIDKWYNTADMGGAAASTPAAGAWVIVPGNAPGWWLALSTDATAPSATDTTLTSEITTGGLARALATYSHTAGASTYQLQKVFTATATFTVNKEAVFSTATQTSGGAMPFESAEPNPPTLVSGDQLTQTVTCSI